MKKTTYIDSDKSKRKENAVNTACGIKMTYEQLKARVQSMISEKRFNHTLGVVEEAGKLAAHYGVSAEKAEIAAILHDCAKDISYEDGIALLTKYGLVIDDITLNEKKLLHGPLAACMSQLEFGVTDYEILDAIWFHTTAKANMALLTKIIYVADFIEPNRSFDGLEIMRDLAYQNIDEALLMGLDRTISDIMSVDKLIHPDTIHARNFLLLVKQKDYQLPN